MIIKLNEYVLLFVLKKFLLKKEKEKRGLIIYATYCVATTNATTVATITTEGNEFNWIFGGIGKSVPYPSGTTTTANVLLLL